MLFLVVSCIFGFVLFFVSRFSSSFASTQKESIDSSLSNAHKQTHFAKTKRQREKRDFLKKVRAKRNDFSSKTFKPRANTLRETDDEKEKRDYNCKKRSSSSSRQKKIAERETH